MIENGQSIYLNTIDLYCKLGRTDEANATWLNLLDESPTEFLMIEYIGFTLNKFGESSENFINAITNSLEMSSSLAFQDHVKSLARIYRVNKPDIFPSISSIMLQLNKPQKNDVLPNSNGKSFTQDSKNLNVENSKLFLSNLDYFTKESEILQFFDQNDVSISKVELCNLKQSNQRHSGYAVVTLDPNQSTSEDLEAALGLDGLNLECEAGPRPVFITKYGEKFDYTKFSQELEEQKVYVSNLPQFCTENELEAFFSKVGKILSCRIAKNKSGKSRVILIFQNFILLIL